MASISSRPYCRGSIWIPPLPPPNGISPTAFRTLLDRFYDVAARVLVAHDGIVDKFVGDEVVGIFIPALAHDEHPGRAIAAARALLDATGHGGPGEPWVPVGVGVATGTAFVGSVGETAHCQSTVGKHRRQQLKRDRAKRVLIDRWSECLAAPRFGRHRALQPLQEADFE